MLTGQIIDSILEVASKGVPSDDERLSPRHIFNRMLTVRGRLLVQKANKRQRISDECYQVLPCVEMVKAGVHECPCLPAPGCGIYRTKYKIPSSMTAIGHSLIRSVTTLDGDKEYSETTWEEKKYKSANRYTKAMPDYYIRSGYIYVTEKMTFNNVVTIVGLFNDPTEAWEYENYCNRDCNDCDNCDSYMDREFPLDNDNINTMVRLVQEELLGPFVQMVEDRTSDSADSPDERSK